MRSAHGDAGSDLVSLCDAILEREVEIRESAPQQGGDLLEMLATIRSSRLVVVDGIGSNEFIKWGADLKYVSKPIDVKEVTDFRYLKELAPDKIKVPGY